MSTSFDLSEGAESSGFPELTPLGKQIEVLRIGRGMSKQHLARYAGTSRQQLWRVMTGKSELTTALRLRLAEALRVPAATLAADSQETVTTTTSAVSVIPEFYETESVQRDPISVDAYLTSVECIERSLRTLPNGDEGRELKRKLLNCLEDLALTRNIALSGAFFDLRRRVLAGEL